MAVAVDHFRILGTNNKLAASARSLICLYLIIGIVFSCISLQNIVTVTE